MDLFGFEFRKKIPEPDLPSFAPPKDSDDGAVVVSAGGAFGTYVDLDGTVRSEAELVTKYREMSLQPECDAAIDEIINESISIDEEHIVQINLEELKITENIKKAIREEFQHCLNLLEFNKFAYEIYRRWYIDGRLYYHIIIDDKNPAAGIKEIRYVDPRKIRKVREVQKKRVQAASADGAVVNKTVNEYFIFNDKGFNFGNKSVGPSTTGLKIARDSVLHVVSGLTDNQGTMVLSYLHKAIKPLNQLRTLEDALVIYRLARAPERRIWYIDVGNLPKMKAEQYVRDIMVKHKNRLIYDAQTGDIRDDRKFMAMLEDYWLPRREGGRGTEVTTLPGGQTLGQMDDVLYFQKKFLGALNVPISRLNSDALFSVGRATEITRDELKFTKYCTRLRGRFSQLFVEMLKKQLILKGILTLEDWSLFKDDIRFDFAKDNYFTELKQAEILEGRINQARNIQDMVGKYYSHEWVRKNVLNQSDDDIADNDKEIKIENNMSEQGQSRWINPAIINNEMLLQQQEMQDQQMQMAQDQQMQPGAEGSLGGDPEMAQKMEQVRNAQIIVDQMKKMPKANRTMADESKYKAAVQVLAKNPELVSRAAAGGAPQSTQQ
jgi:hypothetical protein